MAEVKVMMHDPSYYDRNSHDVSFYDDLFTGTNYENLYKSIMAQYSVAPVETFWGALTGSNQENLYNHNMARSKALAGLAQQMYSEDYQSHSYANEVQSMREAGLNPDLQSPTGSFSSQPQTPDGIPSNSAPNPLAEISSAAGVLMNVFTLGKSISEGVLSFMGQKIDLDLKRLGQVESIAGFIPPISAFSHDGDGSPSQAQIDHSRAVLNTFIPRSRDRRRAERMLNSILQDPRFAEGYYTRLNVGSRNRQEYFDRTSGDHYSNDDQTMQILSEGFSEIIRLKDKTTAERTISDNSERIEYNDTLDSDLQAQSANADATENVDEMSTNTALNRVFRDMVKDLDREARNGSSLARGMQLALQFFLLKFK